IGENVTFTLKYKLIEKLGKSIDKKNLIGTIPVLHTKDYSYPNSEGTWKPHSINEADVISIEFLSRDGKINEKFKLGTGYTVRTPDNIRKGITDTKGKQVQITLNNYNEVIAVIVYDKDAVVDVEGKLVVNSIKNSKNIGKIEVTSRILEGVKPDSFQGQTLIFEVDSTQNNKYKEGSVHSFTAKHDGIDSFIELNFPTN
ncbi:MAG: hypothetical protein Q4Q07_01210, partial [Tissierellia bacterium]|nr:hypothetical protein [Tissierellia bacterium]